MSDRLAQINAVDGTETTADGRTDPAGGSNPAGEIMLSRRTRVGARVSALSGTAFATAIVVTVTVSYVIDTVSSHA
jgi:hypothetical protein